MQAEAPALFVLAGINGAGKSSFYSRHLARLDLPFINADLIAKARSGQWAVTADEAYSAAAEAERQRRVLIAAGKSFCMETVFSHASKLDFLRDATAAGYRVTVVFVGIEGADTAMARVSHRVGHGGHAVAASVIAARYPRVMANLAAVIDVVAQVRLYDNSAPGRDYRLVAVFDDGSCSEQHPPIPHWALAVLPAKLAKTKRPSGK